MTTRRLLFLGTVTVLVALVAIVIWAVTFTAYMR